MTNSKGVTVKILGKDYQVSCPHEKAHKLIDAALILDQQMQKIRAKGRVLGLERIAVMTALNIAYELQEQKSEAQHTNQDSAIRMQDMCDRVDEALSMITIVE